MNLRLLALILLALPASCGRLQQIGQAPEFSPAAATPEHAAMLTYGMEPELAVSALEPDQPSLWTGARGSLLGDRRAVQRGDILTVVIEIDERAEISNATDRSRTGSESMSVPDFFGVPQRINEALPDGASLDPAVSLASSSNFGGDGSVRRNERLTLRVAATIVDVLPNGVLSIQGTQEVRVNFEMRELLVSGYVRPEDISRQNEITYDKIATARISYGGRGQISDMQQPRYGQQAADVILPF
ncbi:MAG: flagellar L-ring protein precursor FlgH [Paracoccaceae bacterium]|jgi:flagellar L-ring protein precursor FlgH